MKEKEHWQGLYGFEHEYSRVLYYFSTTWCSPCKSMVPIMSEASRQYADQLKMITIDVDEQTSLAKKLEVKGVPTLILLDESGRKSELIGGATTEQVKHWLDTQLSDTPNSKN